MVIGFTIAPCVCAPKPGRGLAIEKHANEIQAPYPETRNAPRPSTRAALGNALLTLAGVYRY
jgi:hypothetical protein